jgi:hypothetical protein
MCVFVCLCERRCACQDRGDRHHTYRNLEVPLHKVAPDPAPPCGPPALRPARSTPHPLYGPGSRAARPALLACTAAGSVSPENRTATGRQATGRLPRWAAEASRTPRGSTRSSVSGERQREARTRRRVQHEPGRGYLCRRPDDLCDDLCDFESGCLCDFFTIYADAVEAPGR